MLESSGSPEICQPPPGSNNVKDKCENSTHNEGKFL